MVVSAGSVALVSIAMTVLMIAAMLYLVWGALDSDVHSPSPGKADSPVLDEDDEGSVETEEAQEELADGASA
ncbi:hypothetical protein [Halorubrum tebenquichense]|uniref:Uncharacterized protein n=1 Tax=Halorubrum tebenquichense DSM 14210 TaxID=1227485 RepID=M0DUU2_9EURY|nr:hypothetical protein [Halorubrum tebenquichense]ELZ38467.1 hypothetical protein C472_07303 [Halorubrum tebenquichense DSM 14210]